MVILKFKARDFLLKDERRGKSVHSKKIIHVSQQEKH